MSANRPAATDSTIRREAPGREAPLPALSVAGAGAAGTSLARALQLSGWPVGQIACRTVERARQRAALVGAGSAVSLQALCDPHAGPVPQAPALLLVAVPDRAIAEVAAALAGRPWPAGSVALHLSGSVEVSALAPLAHAGLATGGLHPLRSFVDPEHDARSMAGVVAALEGEPAALALAEQLAARLGMIAFRLAPGARPAWHAAASHACNHLVALLDQALDLMEHAGLARDAARAALLPLMAGTLENLARHAPAEALTGPIVRGDVPAVERHLHALAGAAPDVREAYLALARRALALAVAGRGLDERAAAALRESLGAPPVPPATPMPGGPR